MYLVAIYVVCVVLLALFHLVNYSTGPFLVIPWLVAGIRAFFKSVVHFLSF